MITYLALVLTAKDRGLTSGLVLVSGAGLREGRLVVHDPDGNLESLGEDPPLGEGAFLSDMPTAPILSTGQGEGEGGTKIQISIWRSNQRG